MTLRVVARMEAALNIVVLELKDPEGRDLPPFSAGSHIDIEVAPGLVRQYSLCNKPHERNRYVIGVLRDAASRGGSSGIFENFHVGTDVKISEPRNHFALEPKASRILLFAGGIGITPILCMAYRLSETHVPFVLHYSAKSRARAAFLDQIAGTSLADRTHLYFSDGPAEQKLNVAAALAAPDPEAHIYVCGPAGYIDKVLSEARQAGWTEANLHREFFLPPETDNATQTAGAFQVRLASTGQVFDVPPEKSIATVLLDAGIEIPVSCESGVCGSCITRLLEGTPDHRDFYFTDAEKVKNDQFTPCCSRALTPLLVLDL
jgi:vanillate O-demethylase ferredoxin subunit